MRLLAVSDLHIRDTAPRFRKDNFPNTQYNKIRWILGECVKHEAQLVIAGDVFDKWNVSLKTVARYIRLFREYNITATACAGQHDQRNHSLDLTGTAFDLMEAAGCLVRNRYTCDWGQEIPKNQDILIAHRCITPKPVPFIDYSMTAEEFMGKTSAKVIITGDYHHAHILRKDGRLLVNPGGIMRAAKNEQTRRPKIFLIDLANDTVESIDIPVSKDVFNTEAIAEEKQELTDIERFKILAEKMSKVSLEAADFVSNLGKALAKTNEPVRRKVHEWQD